MKDNPACCGVIEFKVCSWILGHGLMETPQNWLELCRESIYWHRMGHNFKITRSLKPLDAFIYILGAKWVYDIQCDAFSIISQKQPVVMDAILRYHLTWTQNLWFLCAKMRQHVEIWAHSLAYDFHVGIFERRHYRAKKSRERMCMSSYQYLVKRSL